MFGSSYLSCFSTDSQKIGDGWKDLEKIFQMGPIWHFQLYSFRSYKQNNGDCPKEGKFHDLYQPPRKKRELKKMRSWKYFAAFWPGLYMGWTTRNHEKSGSYPSLMLVVEIQSSVLSLLETMIWFMEFIIYLLITILFDS